MYFKLIENLQSPWKFEFSIEDFITHCPQHVRQSYVYE